MNHLLHSSTSFGMVHLPKALNHISSRDHCQRFSPSQNSDTPRVRFELAQNLSSGFGELSCAEVTTTTPRRRKVFVSIGRNVRESRKFVSHVRSAYLARLIYKTSDWLIYKI